MNIALLTVTGNYHVPVLLRNVLPALQDDNILCYLSQRSERLSLFSLLHRYDWRYFLLKLSERFSYKLRKTFEHIIRVPLEAKRYPGLLEILGSQGATYRFTTQIRDEQHNLAEFAPDLIISIYFDQILGSRILRLARCEAINLHPSLLPSYAGSSPTFHALAKGEVQTGVTVHVMNERPDEGALLFQETVPIYPNDTQFTLYRRCTLGFVTPLLSLIETYRRNEIPRRLRYDPDVPASAFSRVTREEVDTFLRAGRRLI